MKKKYKILLIILAVLILILLGLAAFKIFFKSPDTSTPITNVAKVTNKIEGYDYTLDDRDLDLFKELFHELKDNLESEKLDEEKYAETIAKMFVVDLYTMDNKVSKYDIGGLEYLSSLAVESFRAKVLDTLYKTLEDNSYKTRTQELPIVNGVEVTKISPSTYKINNENYNAYEISLSWTYNKKLGYDESGKVTLIKEENKWNVISFQPSK